MRRLPPMALALLLAFTLATATVFAESTVVILDGFQYDPGCYSVTVQVYTDSSKTNWLGAFVDYDCSAHNRVLSEIFPPSVVAQIEYAEGDYRDNGGNLIAQEISIDILD